MSVRKRGHFHGAKTDLFALRLLGEIVFFFSLGLVYLGSGLSAWLYFLFCRCQCDGSFGFRQGFCSTGP